MPLDIDALYRQVEEMVVGAPGIRSEQQLIEAQEFLRRADPDTLRRKLQDREQGAPKIPWLVAEPVDTLAGIFRTPGPPPDFSIAAADGSSIPPDRHSPVRYYVLNTGQAVLAYGQSPDAKLSACGKLYHTEDELYYDHEDKRIPIEGGRLGILMGVQELMGLLDAASKAKQPAVAIRDGSLILWQLQSEDEDQDFCDRSLDTFLSTLDAFRHQDIPVTSYISLPGSHDVANSLRLMLCSHPPGGCKQCPQETPEQRLCRFIAGLLDYRLFQGLLEPGERSDIFVSQSAILSRYREHRIQFFYLNVGGEVARVEAPAWVMQDPAMLDLVHDIVYDQCQRSSQYPPYPPVLIEAHEQAVIPMSDRHAVEEMVERGLAARGEFYARSGKDRSKRNRGV